MGCANCNSSSNCSLYRVYLVDCLGFVIPLVVDYFHANYVLEGGWEYYLFWWNYMFWWVGEVVCFLPLLAGNFI